MSQYMFVSFCYYWFLNHVDETFCIYNIASFNLLDMWSLEKFSLEMHQRSNHSNFDGYEILHSFQESPDFSYITTDYLKCKHFQI